MRGGQPRPIPERSTTVPFQPLQDASGKSSAASAPHIVLALAARHEADAGDVEACEELSVLSAALSEGGARRKPPSPTGSNGTAFINQNATR